MKALEIARIAVVRLMRDRQGLFFVFALPAIIVVVFGLTFGGSAAARLIGLADVDGTEASRALVARLPVEPGVLEVATFPSREDLRDAVEENRVDLGFVVPGGYEAALLAGATTSIEVVARPEAISDALQPILDDAVRREAAIHAAARVAAARRDEPLAAVLAEVRAAEATVGGVAIEAETPGDQLVEPGMSGYLMGAQSQLVLFMFLTSMSAATALIVSRQLGISSRMLSTPTGAGTILVGETLGRYAIALLQGAFILVGTMVVFGVEWGDPLGAAAVVLVFGLIGAGVSMLVGSVATNAEQAGALGVGAAMLLGALGGAMVPPEVFPDLMRTLSFLTPHAWAIDAFRDLALRDADLVAIAPQLVVLGGYAAVLLVLATWRFRRALVR